MSVREEIQNALYKYFSERQNMYNAPYGVLTGLYTARNGGKYRTVTFGISRLLDAVIYIMTPDKLRLEYNTAIRALNSNESIDFTNFQAVIDYFRQNFEQ